MKDLDFTIKKLNDTVDLLEKNLDVSIERSRAITEKLITIRREMIQLTDLLEFKAPIEYKTTGE